MYERLGPCCAFWYFKVLSTGLSQYVAEIWLEIWNTILQAVDLCKELNTQPFPLRFAQSALGASGQAGQRNIPIALLVSLNPTDPVWLLAQYI